MLLNGTEKASKKATVTGKEWGMRISLMLVAHQKKAAMFNKHNANYIMSKRL